METITISSSALKPTIFNIHKDRLKVYQKTSLKEAEQIEQRVRGKGKLQLDKITQSAIESKVGKEKNN